MNAVIIDGQIVTCTDIKVGKTGKVYMQAQISINNGKSRVNLTLLGADLCDKMNAFAKRGLDVIVSGRLYSAAHKNGELRIFVDDIGFVNGSMKQFSKTSDMVLAQREKLMEEEFVDIDDSTL